MEIAVVVKRQIIDGKPQWFYDTADLCEQAVIAEGAHVAVSRRIADAMQAEAEATKLMDDAGRREVMIANAVRKVLGDMVAEGLLIPKRLPARALQQDRLFDESGDGWDARRRGDVVHVTLAYPRVDRNPTAVEVDMMEVRCSDNIRISYDFERDGWVVFQSTNVNDVTDAPWREVGFFKAWAQSPHGNPPCERCRDAPLIGTPCPEHGPCTECGIPSQEA